VAGSARFLGALAKERGPYAPWSSGWSPQACFYRRSARPGLRRLCQAYCRCM